MLHGVEIDRGAIQSLIDEVTAAAAEEGKAHRAALEKLKGLLDKVQREKLMGAIQAKVAEAKDEKHGKDEMHRLAEELKLTADQKKAMAAVIKDQTKDEKDHHAQAKERAEKSLEQSPQHEIARLMAIAQHLAPVLTPEQRATAAAKLRERASGSASLKL